MRVTIVNTCSTLNRGDAAIVLGQIQLLKRYSPGVHIALTSKTPALDEAFYAPLGVEVLAPLTPALSVYKGARRKLLGGGRSLVALGDKRRLIQTVQHSDLVLSCGGGYFYSYRSRLPGTTFWQNVIHAQLALSLGKPLVFLPQSFGPFSSSLARRGVKRLLEAQGVPRVFAREEISYQLLGRMLDGDRRAKVALCPDMALYLDEDALGHASGGEPSDLPRPILAINLREWTFPEMGDPARRHSKRERYLEALSTAACVFIQRYRGSVLIVPQTVGPDPSEDDRGICLEFCRRLSKCVPGSGVVHYQEPDTSSLTGYTQLLSQSTLLIGTRLHACILALLVGVPAISVGYQVKSQGTMELLGLDRFHTDMANVSSEKLLSFVEEIMGHRQGIVEEIHGGLGQARARIDDQVGTLIRTLLGHRNKRPTGPPSEVDVM
jgi:colanic acid/amylovoran biosynthesis protein